jgi:hypothetical protein
MDTRSHTQGSSNPNEDDNPVTLLKGLEDVPKRSVKSNATQEPLVLSSAIMNLVP